MGKFTLPAVVGNFADAGSGTGQKKKKKKNEIFSHFDLTMDKSTAKYMPYSEVAFPRLAFEPTGNNQAAMETMWMVGFLDQDKQAEKLLALSKVDHYINLPGGQLLPHAAKTVRRIYDREERKRRIEKAAEASRKPNAKPEDEDRRSGFETEASILHAKLMAFRRKSLDYGDSTNTRRKHRRSPFYVYGNENKRIRKLLMSSSSGAKLNQQLRAQGMEELFEVKRTQVEASIRIQRAWKRYLRICRWWEFIKQTKAATVIQRHVRGLLTRLLILRWHLRRSWFVVVAQASVRKFLAIKHTKARVEKEVRMVVRIQRLVRAFLSKHRFMYLQSCHSATQIQRMWRGAVARTASDRIWLDKEVALVQALVRGHIARQHCTEYKSRVTHSCIHIQRVFRARSARKRRDNLLWEREMENRRMFLKDLRAEDEYQCEMLSKLGRNTQLQKLEESLTKLRKKEDSAKLKVRQKEYDYMQLKLERGQVSPRAVTQGWVEELDRNVSQHRKWVTQSKQEYLFKHAKNLRSSFKDYYAARTEADKLEMRLRQLREYRKYELESLNTRESERKWRNKKLDLQRRISTQKRRWAVKRYNENGKPIKNLRNNKASKAKVTSELMEHVTGSKHVSVQGQVSLNDGHYGLVDTVPGEQDPVFNVLRDKVASQNSRNMIQQYSSLLKPLFEEMTMAQLDVEVRGFPPTRPKFEDPQEVLHDDETPQEEMVNIAPKHDQSGKRNFGSNVPWHMVEHLGKKLNKFEAKNKRNTATLTETVHSEVVKSRKSKAKRWVVGENPVKS